MIERFIVIHDVKYFKEDINNASLEQIKGLVSFLDKESDLSWVQSCCSEGTKHIIDNIFNKL